eukprot:s720_g40.t2
MPFCASPDLALPFLLAPGTCCHLGVRPVGCTLQHLSLTGYDEYATGCTNVLGIAFLCYFLGILKKLGMHSPCSANLFAISHSSPGAGHANLRCSRHTCGSLYFRRATCALRTAASA